MPTQDTSVDTPVIHSPPKLPDQVRDALRVKRYSIRTECAYVNCIKRLILFYDKRPPQAMGAPELAVFLTDLARRRGVTSPLDASIRA